MSGGAVYPVSVYLSKTITVNGTDYICNTDADTIVLEMQRQGHKYYPAFLANGKVWVVPIEISEQVAISILVANNSSAGVLALNDFTAKSLCNKLGGARGPEGDSISQGYWWHYHGKSCSKAHCWFIT